MYDPRRSDEAARRGAELLGRKLPAGYPPLERIDEARSSRYGYRSEWIGLAQRQRDGELELLEAAVELERQAREAQEALIEALRFSYRAPSWDELGKVLGVTGQGAHKRYRHVEAPRPQTTIEEELAKVEGGDV